MKNRQFNHLIRRIDPKFVTMGQMFITIVLKPKEIQIANFSERQSSDKIH